MINRYVRFGLVAFTAAVCVGALATRNATPPPPSHAEFLQKCSGSSNELVASTSCMSRLRGVVDGHSLTAAIVGIPQGEQLWCIMPNVTNAELLGSVLKWVDTYPQEYAQIMSKTRNATTATLAVTYIAFASSYPCATT